MTGSDLRWRAVTEAFSYQMVERQCEWCGYDPVLSTIVDASKQGLQRLYAWDVRHYHHLARIEPGGMIYYIFDGGLTRCDHDASIVSVTLLLTSDIAEAQRIVAAKRLLEGWDD